MRPSVYERPHRRSMKSASAPHPSPPKAKERTPVSRGLPGSLGNNLLRQFFAFACPSYPCSGFPEIAGVLIPPAGRALGTQVDDKAFAFAWQYATRALARKSPGREADFQHSLGRQRRLLFSACRVS